MFDILVLDHLIITNLDARKLRKEDSWKHSVPSQFQRRFCSKQRIVFGSLWCWEELLGEVEVAPLWKLAQFPKVRSNDAKS